MPKRYFQNAVNRFEYTVNMMCVDKILLMYKKFLSMQKKGLIIVKFKLEKAFKSGV